MKKLRKISFLITRGPLYRYGTGAFGRFLRYAPLTVPTLIALIPPEMEVETEVFDEGVEIVKKEKVDGDIIALSSITGGVRRAYAYADYFRSRGRTVVLGGVHATLMPDEAMAHADTVVSGVAVETWPQLLRDFENGALKKRYAQNDSIDFSLWPVPGRECYLRKRIRFFTINSIQATYGCPHKFDFCVTPYSCKGYNHRPVEDVVSEIRKIRARHIVFVDPSPIEDVSYAMKLYEAMIPLKKTWVSPATIRMAHDEQLLEVAAASGCRGLLIGFESVSGEAIQSIHKGFNSTESYYRDVEKLHRKGIAIMGCFVFGLDGDDRGVFQRTLDFVNRAPIDLPRFTVCTPYPGTGLHERLRAEGRIIEDDWLMYDCQHVVFKPSTMSPGELQEGLHRAWREAYRLPRIIKRIATARAFAGVVLLSSLTYRYYGRRLPFYTREVMTDLSDIADA